MTSRLLPRAVFKLKPTKLPQRAMLLPSPETLRSIEGPDGPVDSFDWPVFAWVEDENSS